MCQVFEFFYVLFPFTFVRDWIIRHHFSRCPECQKIYRQDLTSLLIEEAPGESGIPLWPGIEKKIVNQVQPARHNGKAFSPILKWGYAMVLSLIMILLLSNLRFHSFSFSKAIPPANGREESNFSLLSAQIEGENAKTFIFKPGNSGLVIVFFKKSG